jgi:hypothetical protein
MASSTRSLCFREVYDLRRKGDIGLEEYLTHIVAHYKGVKHEADNEGKKSWLPSGFEDEVREFVLAENNRLLNDAGKPIWITKYWYGVRSLSMCALQMRRLSIPSSGTHSKATSPLSERSLTPPLLLRSTISAHSSRLP